MNLLFLAAGLRYILLHHLQQQKQYTHTYSQQTTLFLQQQLLPMTQ